MIVEFHKSFEKSLDKVKDNTLHSKLEKIVLNPLMQSLIFQVLRNFPGIKTTTVFESEITVQDLKK